MNWPKESTAILTACIGALFIVAGVLGYRIGTIEARLAILEQVEPVVNQTITAPIIETRTTVITNCNHNHYQSVDDWTE